jgi:hypothetical protein
MVSDSQYMGSDKRTNFIDSLIEPKDEANLAKVESKLKLVESI